MAAKKKTSSATKGRKAKRITKKAVQAAEAKPFEFPQDAKREAPTHTPEPDEDPWGDDGLTHKQRMFVSAYCGPAAGNATKAAQIAGYRDDNRESLAVTASDTLRKPYVQRAIRMMMARSGVTRSKVRDTIAALAMSDMSAFIRIDEKGREVIDLKRATEAAAIGHIKEITQDAHEVDGTPLTVVTTKLKLHDPAPYLALMVKILGMGKPRKILHRHRHTGADGKGPIEGTVTHAFNHDAYREQFRRLRSAGAGVSGAGAEPAAADSN